MADNPPDRPNVGVVGLGDIGASIARRIVAAGFPTTVFDIRPEAMSGLVELGAAAAANLGELAQICELVCVIVLNDSQVRSVVATILDTAGPDSCVVVMSTILPDTAVELGAAAAERGIGFIDAAVSGGGEKAAVGGLTVIAGGSDGDIARCRALLHAVASHVFHVGPVGSGSAGKLVNNMLSMGIYALTLEAMDLACAYGIDEELAISFVTHSGGDSRVVRTWGRMDRLRRRTHTLAGTPQMYEVLGKDIRSAAVAAGRRSVILPVTAVIGACLTEKLTRRDAVLDELAGEKSVPRCTGCGHELAPPYRAIGTHPECRDSTASS